MKHSNLKWRTQKFALDVLQFCSDMLDEPILWPRSRQPVRCATSVGANYRSAGRGKSLADFIAKLSIVEEEADESQYWLELISELLPEKRVEIEVLHREAGEIVAIMIASKRTARLKQIPTLPSSSFET